MKDKYIKCGECFCYYEAKKEHICDEFMLALRSFELLVKKGKVKKQELDF